MDNEEYMIEKTYNGISDTYYKKDVSWNFGGDTFWYTLTWPEIVGRIQRTLQEKNINHHIMGVDATNEDAILLWIKLNIPEPIEHD